mgnify:FL=1
MSLHAWRDLNFSTVFCLGPDLWIRITEVLNMTDLKASPCGEMSDQGQRPLLKKLLRDLLERRGLIEDSSIRNEKARVAEKELRRNMYHNTQVMLKKLS